MQLPDVSAVPPAGSQRSQAASASTQPTGRFEAEWQVNGFVGSDIEVWEGEGGANLDKRAEGVSKEPAGHMSA